MTDSQPARSQLRLRGRSFIAVALVPETPVIDWLGRLDAELERAPSFFAGRPVVLDLSATQLHEPGIRALLAQLGTRGIRVLGIEGASESVQALDIPGWPPMLNGGRAAGEVEVRDEPQPPASAEEPASLLVEGSVRSGQSIVFPRGDVTILGSVGSGAEVMAGGCVHVYGALRGRAIAGMLGDSRARIFCRRMEAELLAIDGLYRTAEDMDANLLGRAVQAWLDRDSIVMAALD